MIDRIGDMASGIITKAQPGFKGRKTKWRVAVSCSEVAPWADGRSAAFRRDKSLGYVAVEYMRGTYVEAQSLMRELAETCIRKYTAQALDEARAWKRG